MVQTLTPTSDLHVGAWTTDTGGTSNLYAALADVSDIQLRPIRGVAGRLPVCGRFGFGHRPGVVHRAHRVLGAPQPRIGHIGSAGGTPPGVHNEGSQGTLIASWTTSGVPGTFTTATHTLTGPQADSITNYGALSLRFVGDRGVDLVALRAPHRSHRHHRRLPNGEHPPRRGWRCHVVPRLPAGHRHRPPPHRHLPRGDVHCGADPSWRRTTPGG